MDVVCKICARYACRESITPLHKILDMSMVNNVVRTMCFPNKEFIYIVKQINDILALSNVV